MNSDGGFVTELNDVTLVDNELFSFSVWRELLIDFRGNRKIIKYKKTRPDIYGYPSRVSMAVIK